MNIQQPIQLRFARHNLETISINFRHFSDISMGFSISTHCRRLWSPVCRSCWRWAAGAPWRCRARGEQRPRNDGPRHLGAEGVPGGRGAGPRYCGMDGLRNHWNHSLLTMVKTMVKITTNGTMGSNYGKTITPYHVKTTIVWRCLNYVLAPWNIHEL